MPGTLKRELGGIALILLAVFLGGALIEHQVLDAARLTGNGFFGPVGKWTSWTIVRWLGIIAAAIVPFVPLVHGLRLLGRMQAETDRRWMLFLLGLTHLIPIGVGLTLSDIAKRTDDSAAGLWGGTVSFVLASSFGELGAWITVVLLLSGLTAWTLRWNPVRALVGPRPPSGTAVVKPALATLLEPPPEEMPEIERPPNASSRETSRALSAIDPVQAKKKRLPKAKEAQQELPIEEPDLIPPFLAVTPEDALEYKLPAPDLLSAPPPGNVDVGKREIEAMGEKLMHALRTFRVEGALVGKTTGPVVTQYEVEPAPGVKVRQFANLANDLALAMRASSIRVVAPIPGRGAVGVEVPNPIPQIVAFRELIESREFSAARMALPIALGKDLEGKVVVADLAKMPHLLIAGATGSGKSVCVNTIITSLVYRHTPDTLKFLMVDPKMVELSAYNDLPHMLNPVITDNRDAPYVLKWAVAQMQTRYELLAANGSRNIQEFNKRVLDQVPLVWPKRPEVAFERVEYKDGILPYVVLVIDELADLMMTVQGEVETPLAMLAQKARAIGIHIILATQRPSVNVITGLIKANFPSRIAFRVASQVDSRTIIDGMGAESLLGNGDMLFIPPGKSEPQRLQGAFIPGEDTERLMKWFDSRTDARRAALAAKGLPAEELIRPDIIAETKAREALDKDDGDDDESASDKQRDAYFRKAAETCIQHQLGSTSLLQRRLGIGYGRAARIIDQLHTAGVLGPPNGSKPREILVGFSELDRIAGVEDL